MAWFVTKPVPSNAAGLYIGRNKAIDENSFQL